MFMHLLLMIAVVAGSAGALSLACARSPNPAPVLVRRTVYRRG